MLTESRIKAARPPERAGAAGSKLFDGGGLYLLIDPSGAKGWRLKYRLHGRERLLSIGPYPEISLRTARDKREEIRRAVREGIDPIEQRRAAKLANRATFGIIGAEYLESRKAGTSPATQAKRDWLFGLLRPLHSRPIASIAARDLLLVLKGIEGHKARHETTRRCKMVAGQIFNYAQQQGHACGNPAGAITSDALKPVIVEHHAGLTDPVKVGALMRAIDGYDGHGLTRYALRLTPLVAVRPGELRGARWSEFDLDGATWRIPAERMKMRQPHIVPLSRQAVAILRDIEAFAGPDTDFVFPSVRDRPLSENAIGSALRRMGYLPEAQTWHGFRTTFSTLLHELGEPHELIELQLAHMPRDKVSAAYNHAKLMPERRRMMQRWADYLDELRAKK